MTSKPKKYRKKPVVVEAMLFEGTAESALAISMWAHEGLPSEANAIVERYAFDQAIYIRTLEGDMLASPGDWIIKGVAGEFYPCKSDIFAATYDEVQE